MTNQIRRVAPLLAVVLGMAACNGDLTDINNNPNVPTSAPAPYLLTAAQTSAIGRILGANFNMTLTALWSQQFAKIQYIDEDRYELRPATVDAHWTGLYSGPLKDLKEVIRQGTEQNKPNYVAIGNIMSAWTFQVMTDVWGDIPYSEALQGSAQDGGNATPKYDPQQAIYTDLLARLTTASGQLAPDGGDFGSADVLYGGDPAAWRKFANSLRLRIAMRTVNADPAMARQQFEAALAAPGGVFTSNADNAALAYGTAQTDANPLFINQQTRDDHAVSATIIDTLKSFDDPRLGIYADPTPAYQTSVEAGNPLPETQKYVGMPNGAPPSYDADLPGRSRIGEYFVAPNAPAVLMSYAEVLFLRAEAAARGWNAGGTAEELYNQAVTASMEQYGVSAEEIEAYLANPKVAFNSADALRLIAVQKWLALYANGPEAYAEWRRTGYPVLVPAAGGTNDGKIPVRVPYPTIEQSLNNTNLKEAVSRQGGLTLNDPVWWDR